MDKVSYKSNITQTIYEDLNKISLKGRKIDEFEKLYVLVSAKSSRGTLITESNFKEEDFDNIKTLEQYIKENILSKNGTIEQSSLEFLNMEDDSKISNYYMIPRNVSQVVRMGNDESVRELKPYVLVDNDGYSLYTVMEDGKTIPSKILKQEIQKHMEGNYKLALASGIVSIDNILEYINPGEIESLAIFLESNRFSLRDVKKTIDTYMFEKVLTEKTIVDKGIGGKDISTLEETVLDEYNDPSKLNDINENRGKFEGEEVIEEEIAEQEGLTVDNKEKIKDEAKTQMQEKEALNRAGINDDALRRIAMDNGCKIEQINIRILGTREALNYTEELTGANLKHFKGRRSNGC